jgi:4'-phosphopantetheinyl transferase
MPLTFQKSYTTKLTVAVWEISESLTDLEMMVPLSEKDYLAYAKIPTEHHQKQHLAKYKLQKIICDHLGLEGGKLEKDQNGKPILVAGVGHISISHTQNLLAMGISLDTDIGIDLEVPRPKILNVSSRVFSEPELAIIANDIDKATILWSSKEALYKIYGKRKVNFKDNLIITYKDKTYMGHINMPDHVSKHKIIVEKIGETYLITAI